MLLASDNVAPKSKTDSMINVILTSEVRWEQLNPARGTNSPLAATLWGNRTGPGPSGFLLKPVDGFKSPPHIHTANYSGVVIKGSIHNAEPDSKELYLPPASFWTQPGGGIHITAAKGSSLAYIEVEGAFDVLPAEKATDHHANATVMSASSISWGNLPGMPVWPDGPKMAVLWGNPHDDQISGALVKLPAGFTGIMRNIGPTFHAVVIQGELIHRVPGENDVKTLKPGSYFGSKGELLHKTTCVDEENCIIYIRKEGKLDVSSASF